MWLTIHVSMCILSNIDENMAIILIHLKGLGPELNIDGGRHIFIFYCCFKIESRVHGL